MDRKLATVTEDPHEDSAKEETEVATRVRAMFDGLSPAASLRVLDMVLSGPKESHVSACACPLCRDEVS